MSLEILVGRAQKLIEGILARTRVSEAELLRPRLSTGPKVITQTVLPLLVRPQGLILLSSFVLLMAWGENGSLQVLRGVEGLQSLGLPLFWSGWGGTGSDPASRDQIIPGLAWDQELICYVAGFVLLVVLPAIFIRVVLRESLSEFGLCLPPKDRWRFAITSALGLAVLGVPAILLAAGDADMQAEYPMFRGAFESNADFIAYELVYLLFFVVIEFVFRGYLLFGLYKLRDADVTPPDAGLPRPLFFGYAAILIAMLSYTAWHLGKPQLELWSTLPWGLAAGAIALVSRSIVPIIFVHWGLNVILDTAIRNGWSLSSIF